jgi:hypothetical protein
MELGGAAPPHDRLDAGATEPIRVE